MSIATQATRFRPSEPVQFRNPIRGVSGAELHAYEWKWRPEDFVDGRGEDRTKRVSDWDRAEASNETGRELVHQFTVKSVTGEFLIVSAEGVLRLLGFTTESETGVVVSAVSLVKKVARLQLSLAVEEARVEAERAIQAQVLELPLPPVEMLGKAYPSSPTSKAIRIRMGDATVIQIEGGSPTKERIECLTQLWRSYRENERGLIRNYSAVHPDAIRQKIKKLMRKIDLLTGNQKLA